jgi:hypothetical protein
LLENVEFRRTGGDGGHLYLKGTAAVPDHGLTDVYAYFCSRIEELEFEKTFAGGNVRIEAESIEYNLGIGAAVREITSWGLSNT